MLLHAFHLVQSLFRESAKRTERSPQWAALERAFKVGHPRCAACGTAKRLQVHHVRPFHLFPELELEPSNLIVLCMGVKECHLALGHGGKWQAWNPHVRHCAAMARAGQWADAATIARNVREGAG